VRNQTTHIQDYVSIGKWEGRLRKEGEWERGREGEKGNYLEPISN